MSNLNRKITQNKSKHLLVENELNNLKTFDSSYFIGNSHFEEDGVQNYSVFQPMYKYFKSDSSYHISSWTSKGLSNESIESPSAPNNFLTSSLNYVGIKIRGKFNGSCLKQDKVTYTHGKIVNIYIVYEINKKDNTVTNDPKLENCLFGAVTLTKNADIDKYRHSGYGIGFDRKGSFSFPSGGYGQNVMIVGVDMSSSIHIDNKKDILILGRGPAQGLESTLTAEKMHSTNFTEKNKIFCLSIHYNGANSYLFVNGTEIHKFKAKDSKIVATLLCVGNISKDWSTDNMKKKKQVLMDMFMTLVLIMMLLIMMILKTFIVI